MLHSVSFKSCKTMDIGTYYTAMVTLHIPVFDTVISMLNHSVYDPCKHWNPEQKLNQNLNNFYNTHYFMTRFMSTFMH